MLQPLKALALEPAASPGDWVHQAPPQWGPPIPIELTGDEAALPLARNLQWLEDRVGAWELMQVQALDQGWYAGSVADTAAAFSSSAWWMRLALHNPTDRAQESIIDLGTPHPDHLHWYVFDSEGSLHWEQMSGDRLPQPSTPSALASWTTSHATLALKIEPQQTLQVYLRIDSQDGLHPWMRPTLSSRDAFERQNTWRLLGQAVMLGSLLMLILLWLLQGCMLRRVSWGLQGAWMLCALVWMLAWFGAERWLGWTWPGTHHRLLTGSMGIGGALAGMLIARLLHLRSTAPRWVQMLTQALCALCAIGGVLGLLDLHALSMMTVAPTLWLLGVWLSILSAWFWLRGVVWTARWTAPAALLFTAALTWTLLCTTGALPEAPFPKALLPVAVVLCALLLAAALVSRERRQALLHRMEALAAKQTHQQALEALSAMYEVQQQKDAQQLQALSADVQTEREQVQQLQQHLSDMRHHLPRMDWSGAASRLKYQETLQQWLAEPPARPLAACWIEATEWTAFADAQTMLQSDGLLHNMADALASLMPGGASVLARLEGSRFGLCWQPDALPEAQEQANALVTAVSSLPQWPEGLELRITWAEWTPDRRATLTVDTVHEQLAAAWPGAEPVETDGDAIAPEAAASHSAPTVVAPSNESEAIATPLQPAMPLSAAPLAPTVNPPEIPLPQGNRLPDRLPPRRPNGPAQASNKP